LECRKGGIHIAVMSDEQSKFYVELVISMKKEARNKHAAVLLPFAATDPLINQRSYSF